MLHSLRSRVQITGWVNPDFSLTVTIGTLFALGLVMIQSATVTQVSGSFLSGYFLRQLTIGAVGIGLAAVAYHRVSMETWRRLSPWLLLGGGFLLLAVHIPGVGIATKEGARRWLDLGVFTFQPVEAVKIFLILYLSAYCARQGAQMRRLSSLGTVVIVCIFLGLLLLAQPDFGSAFILVAIAGVIVFVAGASLWHLAGGAAACLSAVAVALLASPYRMARITSYRQPFDDPLGAGYHQTHSLMAFGQGGWVGRGLGLSIEKWSHLPEAHNDFIISVIAEELGFVGFAFVIALYSACIVRCFLAADEASTKGDKFACNVLVGIATLFALQVGINVGGNLALSPVKGLTLPFVSYGGSSLLISLLMVGIALRALRELRHPPDPDSAPKYRHPEMLPWDK